MIQILMNSELDVNRLQSVPIRFDGRLPLYRTSSIGGIRCVYR